MRIPVACIIVFRIVQAAPALTRLIAYRYDVFDNLIARLDNTDGVGAIEETRFYIHDPAPGKGGAR